MSTKKQEDVGPAGSEQPSKSEKTGSFRNVLRNRAFVLIWLAQLISQIGFNAANYGLITIVTEVTGSTVMVGIAIVCFTLPAVPFSLLAGVYVDYLDKRTVMWVSNMLRAIASLLIVVALLWNPHGVVFLFLFTFLISMVTQFFMPAEASAIPLLVGKKDLVPALSLFNITLNIAQAIGFLLLGRLIESLFAPFPLHLGSASVTVTPHDMLFVVIAIGYLLCTLLVLAIPRTKLQSVAHNGQNLPKSLGKEMWAIVQHDIKGTWEFVRKDRRLFISILQVSFVNILLLVIGELAGPFVQQVLHLPVDNLTLIFAPAGFGLVLGGIVMPLLTRYLGKGFSITVGSILTAMGLVMLPLSQVLTKQISFLHTWSFFIVGATAFVLGVALDMINIPAQTVMQERAPEEERARVFSFQFMLNNAGSIPVLLFAGLIADTLGIATVMYGLGVAILLFLWWTSHYEHTTNRHKIHTDEAK
ncbi:MAG: MFS transporter [Ktedonobacteraceae bacterium]